MSAPVKSYTDPTNISKQPQVNIAQYFHTSTSPTQVNNIADKQLISLVMFQPQRPIIFCKGIDVYNLSPVPAQVPKPPVGKMLINTFPSIYKEHTGSVGLAAVARVYPPIYIQHMITD